MIGPHDPDGPDVVGPATHAQPSAWNLPNALTVLRILLVPVFVWLLMRDGGADGAAGDRWWATVVFVVATVTDWVDGDLARRRGLVTAFGKLMDPIADKALMGSALICLSLLGELPWWVTVVILVREVGITLMRFVVIRRGVIPASRGGKLKTVLQAVGLILMLAPLGTLLNAVGLWVMYAAVFVTVVTGVDYLRQAFGPRPAAPS
ncbi:CDP-diacylglycerol--glycerol-3-phosphate 3-phosphatidyltransferase [Ornithinimicrobium avium]|uniref:CDP-diacylglycerol--glycerol-3-phosphate 3-phosphatidyltransferase n=1 Tax=Ornithinimicrobium avium TaxID=2283195 RepID=A0A345NIC9_9MICO|nr:CDP-diacylglycerol--glycerol-3-phosphate 3-phosphatidyltransferase [Ornithinimicrobium avium]